PEVHVVLVAVAPDTPRLEAALARARAAYRELSGITAIWRQDCHILPGEQEAFGYRDGVSHPAIEGYPIAGATGDDPPLKPGELVLGYPDELSDTPLIPQPEVLGRNGSFVAFRKLHQRVAMFRSYLKAQAGSVEGEE